MIVDTVRMNAYAAAIAATVKPGDVVLDLGTGTGICALLACRAGAARVYAVDLNRSVEVAKKIAASNGLGDRIQFFQCDSRTLELPEKVDVIISDLRGVMPLYAGNFALVKDAKQRFLKPGGALLPQHDTLMMAPLASCRATAANWGAYALQPLGIDLSAGEAVLRHAMYDDRPGRIQPTDLLSAAQPWAELAYGDEDYPLVRGNATFVATRAATLEGLALWFDGEIADGITLSNAPGSDLVYARAFLPSTRAVPVQEGSVIEAKVWAHAAEDGYAWSWYLRVNNEEFRVSSIPSHALGQSRTSAT